MDQCNPIPTQFSVSFMSTAQDQSKIRTKAAELACTKAFALMQDQNLGTSCLTAAFVAQQVLTSFNIPCEVRAGYMHMDGAKECAPHTWVVSTNENGEEVITDLTFSGVGRMAIFLGRGFGMHEDAKRAVYSTNATLPVVDGALPFEVISSQAKDLTGYMSRAPQWMQDAIPPLLEQARDPSPKVTFSKRAMDRMQPTNEPGPK